MDFMDNIIVTEKQFENVLDILGKSNNIVFDLETNGLSFLDDEIVGIGVGTLKDDFSDIEHVFYIPVAHHHGINDLLAEYWVTKGIDRAYPQDFECYLPPDYVFERLKPLFLDYDKLIIAHNLKFDIQFLINVGIDLRPKLGLPTWYVPETKEAIMEMLKNLPKKASCADTMVMSWLLDENKRGHGLKFLAQTELGLDMTKLDAILGKGKKQKKFHEASARETLPYALMDIVATGKLFARYYPQLKAEKLDEVFFRVEMPFVGVLQGIERRGMPVNRKVLEAIGERCERELEAIQSEIFRLAGKPFNIGSNDQLAEIVHGELGLPVLEKTKSGKISMSAETLELLIEKGNQAREMKGQLAEKTERGLKIVEKVLEYRKIKKVHSTYVKGLIENIASDGRIHCSFNHTGTVTGRLSSSDPNLQNLPAGAIFKDYITVEEYESKVAPLREQYKDDKHALEVAIQKAFMFTVVPVAKNEKGKWEPTSHEEAEMYEIQWKIRDAFQDYERDWWLIVGDYSQMELRMTAYLTGDATMAQGFINGEDIHYYNASIVTGKPIDAITKEERRDAKAVSFGLIYGKTVRGFAVDWYGKEPDFWVKRPTDKDPFGEINKKYLDMTQEVVDRFFNGFPDVANGIAATHQFIEKYGFVKMITGRKRRIPEIFSQDNGQKNRAKRQAFNARVQGSSADFIKMAMVKLERELYIYQDPSTEYLQGQLAQVHDELMLEAKPDRAPQMLETTKDIMANVVELRTKSGVVVPIEADLELGFKYGSCK